MESVADRGSEGLRDLDLSSVRTRSRVLRGLNGCFRCNAAPGLMRVWEALAAFASTGRAGETVFGPPNFWESTFERSGKRAP